MSAWRLPGIETFTICSLKLPQHQMSKYSLTKFTPAIVSEARAEWEALAGTDAYDLEFANFFDWVDGHISESDNDSTARSLYNNDSQRTDAIVEVVASRKGQMFKLLKIVPSPRFWDANNLRKEIIELYTEVFFNVITAGGFGTSRKVKLYGRDDEMMSILRSIHSGWSIPGSSADFEGRFLTISINPTE